VVGEGQIKGRGKGRETQEKGVGEEGEMVKICVMVRPKGKGWERNVGGERDGGRE
jgi:hypothetical protein